MSRDECTEMTCPHHGAANRARIDSLIAASSLGTPEAVALRASVSDEAVAAVMARVDDERPHTEDAA